MEKEKEEEEEEEEKGERPNISRTWFTPYGELSDTYRHSQQFHALRQERYFIIFFLEIFTRVCYKIPQLIKH